MTDPAHKERMAALEARLAKLREQEQPKPHQGEQLSQAHLAWRMVIELVAGLLIGFGIGYGLDALFGTLPIFLVVFCLLGLVAGIRTMMRSAREVAQQTEATIAASDAEGRAGEDERNKENGD